MYAITPEQAANELSPIFKGWWGRLLYHVAMKVTGISRANQTHYNVAAAGIPAAGADGNNPPCAPSRPMK